MAELLLKPRTLGIEDLSGITALGRIENDAFLLSRSPKGYKLKTPVTIPLETILAVGQRGLVEYIVRSLASERPRLIPLVLENRSLLELARYLLRYRTGSAKTLYVNVDCIVRYALRTGISPDQLLADMKDDDALPRYERIPKHVKALEDYVSELQDQGLAPSRVANYVKAIRSLYRVNGVDIKLPYALSRRSVTKDRAPRQEELQLLLDISDLRERVIICLLALGGFREGTLVRLQYHHVRQDLENGIVPIHVHVESEITKGKYHDYDTFLGQEAVEYLKLYLERRKQGSPDGKIPPEMLHDRSPLVRNAQSAMPKPLGEKQIYKLVHGVYHKAGLLNKNEKGGYDLRVHSLRKFFKTQTMALGVQSDYVDYMMGHTVSTYHDIQSKGVEFLRNVYASAGLSIKPRTGVTKIDMLKEMMRAWGLEPEKILTREALAEPHRSYLSSDAREKRQVQLLAVALRDGLKKELLASFSPTL